MVFGSHTGSSDSRSAEEQPTQVSVGHRPLEPAVAIDEQQQATCGPLQLGQRRTYICLLVDQKFLYAIHVCFEPECQLSIVPQQHPS